MSKATKQTLNRVSLCCIDSKKTNRGVERTCDCPWLDLPPCWRYLNLCSCREQKYSESRVISRLSFISFEKWHGIFSFKETKSCFANPARKKTKKYYFYIIKIRLSGIPTKLSEVEPFFTWRTWKPVKLSFKNFMSSQWKTNHIQFMHW